MKGTVYLLHFSRPLKHAKHYLGYTKVGMEIRLIEHRDAKGRGARLTQVAIENGISLALARVWKNKGRKFERQLKNRKNAKRLCPICKGQQEANYE